MESKFIPVRGNPSSPTKNTDYPFWVIGIFLCAESKECYETEYWLELFQRAGITDLASLDPLRRAGGTIRRILIASVNTAKKSHVIRPVHTVGGFFFCAPPHTPGAPRRAASSRRDRLPTSVSKQSAHTVSPPRTHGHRYASAHGGSGAKHTSHRRIRVPPFRLQNYYAFG